MTTQNQNQNDRTMMKLNFYAFLLAALFLFGTTHAQAQETKFGLKGGAALYTVTASISAFGESEEEKSDTHTGFGAGLFAEIPVSDIVSLQLEGLYMQKGASDELDEADIDVVWVPGSFEIPLAAKKLADKKEYDGVIALGAVIRGETPHFDYVSAEVSKGVAKAGLDTEKPVIFGVLTTDTIEQAISRAGTKSGNKGYDAAVSLIEMVNLFKELD